MWPATLLQRLPLTAVTNLPGRARRRRRPFLPRLEALECRVAPATFTVNNTGDSGTGSLRQAILDADNSPGPNVIQFNIASSGVQTIQPASPLPAITNNAVTIDGTTEPNYSGRPLIVLDGTNAGSSANGLTITAGSCTVKGLAIGHFFIGIDIAGGQAINNTLESNFIGTANGVNQSGNFYGVRVQAGASNNSLGQPGAGNVISGNVYSGLLFQDTSANQVLGNFIGTDATGKLAVPNDPSSNALDGVDLLDGAVNNTIGGSYQLGQGNVISGNGSDGVFIADYFQANDPATGNLVEGNFIGTDASGTVALGNQGNGVDVARGAENNIIGGTTPGLGNVISGNGGLIDRFSQAGVQLSAFVGFGPDTGNVVEGNKIGTDASGTSALGNLNQGIAIQAGTSNNTVGGTAGAGNLISGNTTDGVLLSGSGTTGNQVLANFIGTTADGSAALGNGLYGVDIEGASGNLIGAAGAGNVISGNLRAGVVLQDASANLLQGNFIGTDASGKTAVPNDPSTLHLDGVDLLDGAVNNTIGGSSRLGQGNVIAGNGADGVFISDYHNANDPATGNLVEGNFIGTDATGIAALPNDQNGVHLEGGAQNNTVGGTTSDLGNLLSGNGSTAMTSPFPIIGAGVQIAQFFGFGPDTGNVVEGNRIGTDVSGTSALGNLNQGVAIQAGASNNLIGGTAPGAGNVISGNSQDGVVITGSGTTGNQVQANLIGTTADGSHPLANKGYYGVLISGGATNNTIGGASQVNAAGQLSGAGNLISADSGGIGVLITGGGSNGNVVQGNFVGTDFTGTHALGNGDGVDIEEGASGNTVGGAYSLGAGGRLQGLGNLISGNVFSGVFLNNFNSTSSPLTGNVIQGNFVGTDVTGTRRLANGLTGIWPATGAMGTVIGGTARGTGNIVSGSGSAQFPQGEGIFVGPFGIQPSSPTGTVIQGNLIGTDVSGQHALGSLGDGVDVVDAPGTTIGGTAAGAGNVISGNGGDGVNLQQVSGALVQGNFIGAAADGSHPLGNAGNGVVIDGGASNNTVGGADAGNVISGNGKDGVIISTGATGNYVLANFIGTSADGTAALGNGQDGVAITNGASANIIGAAGAGNVISGNAGDGVHIDSFTTGNHVLANFIGTSADGGHPVGNATGVAIDTGASNNTIGGTTTGAGNVISGNTTDGVLLSGSGTTGNQVLTNFIGTTADGSTALGNGTGVAIAAGASSNTIGGVQAGNVVSGNTGDGVLITDSGTTGNRVLANLIGTTAANVHPLGNGGNGVNIEAGASNNVIGGAAPGNIIAFNRLAGVVVAGSATTGDTLSLNSIYANSALGIDLGADGVTPNTPLGPHTGPNALQNYPVLTPYTTAGTVTGTLNSTPSTTFRLEFFANATPDASGHGQGRDYLGYATVTTDTNGNASFTSSYTSIAGEPFVSATATDAAGNTSEFSATVDAALTATGLTLSATEGTRCNGVVATFIDADSAATAAAFTASIAWGDGAVTGGTVVTNPSGGFLVTGSHTYSDEASTLPVTVIITDMAASSRVTANSLMNVADAPLTVSAAGVSAVEGATFSGQVGTFTDAAPNAASGDHSVLISWGDGSVSSGTVTALGSGLFGVSGTHTYAEEGTYTLSLSVRDIGGATAAGSAQATVADAPLQATGRSLKLTGHTLSGVLATFTDANPGGTLNDYSATIDWGDGTTTSGDIGSSTGVYTVFGSHTYRPGARPHTITITIRDAGGSTITVVDTIQ
jgi:hypothetical protein